MLQTRTPSLPGRTTPISSLPFPSQSPTTTMSPCSPKWKLRSPPDGSHVRLPLTSSENNRGCLPLTGSVIDVSTRYVPNSKKPAPFQSPAMAVSPGEPKKEVTWLGDTSPVPCVSIIQVPVVG